MAKTNTAGPVPTDQMNFPEHCCQECGGELRLLQDAWLSRPVIGLEDDKLILDNDKARVSTYDDCRLVCELCGAEPELPHTRDWQGRGELPKLIS